MGEIPIVRCKLSCGCSIMVVFDGEDPTDPIRWCSLHAAAPALLAAVTETREAAAACFRAFIRMEEHAPADSGKNQAILEDEIRRAGVRNGFGIRADIAIASAVNDVPRVKELKKAERERAAKERREANVQ